MSSFKPHTRRKPRKPELVSIDELMSRCDGAARMAMRGARYTQSDREECAAEVRLKIWEKIAAAPMGTVETATRSSVAHGSSVAYSKHSAQKSRDTVKVAGRMAAVPAELVRWEYLLGIAANVRRSLDASRDRDHMEALRRAADTVDFSPHVEAPADETGGTPWGARRTAVDMLRSVGMLGDSEPVHWGPVWTLAYCAARAVIQDGQTNAADGLDRDTVAEELEIDRATLKKHLQRAIQRMPAAQTHARAAWAEALNIPEGGIARKPSRSRSEAADMGTRHNGPRDHLAHKDHAPITVKRDKRIARKPDAWRTHPRHCAPWTAYLPQNTRNRLAAAASIRQERDRAKTDSEREALRVAALAR